MRFPIPAPPYPIGEGSSRGAHQGRAHGLPHAAMLVMPWQCGARATARPPTSWWMTGRRRFIRSISPRAPSSSATRRRTSIALSIRGSTALRCLRSTTPSCIPARRSRISTLGRRRSTARRCSATMNLQELQAYVASLPTSADLEKMSDADKQAFSDRRRWALVYYSLSLASEREQHPRTDAGRFLGGALIERQGDMLHGSDLLSNHRDCLRVLHGAGAARASGVGLCADPEAGGRAAVRCRWPKPRGNRGVCSNCSSSGSCCSWP